MLPQETRGKARKIPRKGNWKLSKIPKMRIQRIRIKAKTYASTMAQADMPRTYYVKSVSQISKTEEMKTFQQEGKVHQAWSKCCGRK